jgi:hypothetical protein
MKIRLNRTGKLLAATAIATSAAMLPVSALAATGSPAQSQHPARHAHAAANCRFQQIKVWLGIGNGTAAPHHLTYPLEFSNVGRFTCSLFGFPGVSGVFNGHQVGGAAAHLGSRFLAILAPGQTAHAPLTIIAAGSVAGCVTRPSTRLRVIAPNQTGSTIISGFTYTACTNRTTLAVQSVRYGTGIPGLHF